MVYATCNPKNTNKMANNQKMGTRLRGHSEGEVRSAIRGQINSQTPWNIEKGHLMDQ